MACAGKDAALWLHSTQDWRSITFAGERHGICLKVPHGYNEQALVRAIDADTFRIVGLIVADVQFTALEHEDGHCWLSIEILTLFDEGGPCC